MGLTDKLDSLNEASLREYALANTFALISAIFVYIFTELGKSFPIIDGRLITVTAISVGVAYGVESWVVLYLSGVLKGSIKNEYDDELWIDILKVVLLILFAYIFLNNSSAVQGLLTRVVYAISFFVFILSGYISVNTDAKEIEEMDKVEIIMILLFLSVPLIMIGFVVAFVASLLPTIEILAFALISIILLSVWYFRVNH